MKFIPLTRGQRAMVDDSDYERLAAITWCARWDRKTNSFYARSGKKTMARMVVEAPKGVIVDHRNHDTLDNRRSNLRICSNAENSRNARKKRGTAGRYKGISLHHSGAWSARIKVNGKDIYLGRYRTQEEAALAYRIAATEHHGEFAFEPVDLAKTKPPKPLPQYRVGQRFFCTVCKIETDIVRVRGGIRTLCTSQPVKYPERELRPLEGR